MTKNLTKTKASHWLFRSTGVALALGFSWAACGDSADNRILAELTDEETVKLCNY